MARGQGYEGRVPARVARGWGVWSLVRMGMGEPFWRVGRREVSLGVDEFGDG